MNASFVRFMDSWPNWLRYIISLPSYVVAYFACYCVLGFYSLWYAVDPGSIRGLFIDGLSHYIAMFVALKVLFDIIPKHKFSITVIISSLEIIMLIVGLICLILDYSALEFRYFWSMLVTNLANSISLIVTNILLFKSEQSKIEISRFVDRPQ